MRPPKHPNLRSRAGQILRSALAAVYLSAIVGCAAESPYNQQTSAPDTIRVLAYNIHHGEGMDDSLDLDRIAALIREVDPDLVALQEVDSAAGRTGRVDQATELGRLTGLNSVFGAFMPYDGGAYGMAVLSRWQIVESANLRLPDGEEPRTSLAVAVEVPNSKRKLRFVGIHFYRTEDERLAQAQTLEQALGNDTVPTILAGDFNSTPGSEVMGHLEIGWKVLAKGEDNFTFSSFDPEREIDFVLVRPVSVFQVIRQDVLDEPVASDHRPVLVDLVIRN